MMNETVAEMKAVECGSLYLIGLGYLKTPSIQDYKIYWYVVTYYRESYGWLVYHAYWSDFIADAIYRCSTAPCSTS